jgi:colanic acid biosynthesis glycosyl transferase WcaI
VIGLFSVRRPDVIHVCQGPATLMIPAILYRLVFRSPVVLDIQDLWPESVISSGMFHVPGGLWMLERWCKFTYAACDRIMVLSFGYRALLENRGASPNKISVVHNWCDENSIANLVRIGDVGARFGLDGKFNVIFAGTMGKAQALDAVFDAAGLLRNELPTVQFVFVGGGIDAPRLMELTAVRELANVVFIPRQVASEISKILAFADALLIHLRADLLGRTTIPQKTQAYLAAGKPIIMAVDGEAAGLVKEANAGIVCMPENPQSIATAVRELFAMSSAQREAMGKNGQRYYRENMSFEIGLQKVINVYTQKVQGQ